MNQVIRNHGISKKSLPPCKTQELFHQEFSLGMMISLA